MITNYKFTNEQNVLEAVLGAAGAAVAVVADDLLAGLHPLRDHHTNYAPPAWVDYHHLPAVICEISVFYKKNV